MDFVGRTGAMVTTGMLAVLLSGCVGVQLTLPTANPDKHPVPKTAPAEDLGIAYFRHHLRWHQMRVELAVGEPKASGSGHIVKFSADASLWRFNNRTREYDIPADFVRTDSFQDVYIEHDEKDAKRIAIRTVVSSAGGGGAAGWRARPYTHVSAKFDGVNGSPAREQQVSGTVTASFRPNGSSNTFGYQAQIEREWIVKPTSATEIEIVQAKD